MKRISLVTTLLLLFSTLSSFASTIYENQPSPNCSLETKVDTKGVVEVFWSFNNLPLHPSEVILFRTTAPILPGRFRDTYIPAFMILANNTPAGSIKDQTTADGTAYRYQAMARSGSKLYWTNISIANTPAKKLRALDEPYLWVDKVRYTLSVYDKQGLAKRYPVALGAKPTNRKLHQDRASTPEGVYHITNLQNPAHYFLAYDINYPNSVDKFRYNHAKKSGKIPAGRGIGGEIQIHGDNLGDEMAIRTNWTAGCISMQNQHIRELFHNASIRVNTPVYITGYSLTSNDLYTILKYEKAGGWDLVIQSLRGLGFLKAGSPKVKLESVRKALLNLQRTNKLPLTGQVDYKTAKILFKNP